MSSTTPAAPSSPRSRAATPGRRATATTSYSGAVLDTYTDGSCATAYYLEPLAYYAAQGSPCTTGAWSRLLLRRHHRGQQRVGQRAPVVSRRRVESRRVATDRSARAVSGAPHSLRVARSPRDAPGREVAPRPLRLRGRWAWSPPSSCSAALVRPRRCGGRLGDVGVEVEAQVLGRVAHEQRVAQLGRRGRRTSPRCTSASAGTCPPSAGSRCPTRTGRAACRSGSSWPISTASGSRTMPYMRVLASCTPTASSAARARTSCCTPGSRGPCSRARAGKIAALISAK